MASFTLHPSDPDWKKASFHSTTELGSGLVRTISVARALVDHGRRIDLSGLDHGVGLFCAKALDLSHEEGQAVRPHLITLLNEVDRLIASLRGAEDH